MAGFMTIVTTLNLFRTELYISGANLAAFNFAPAYLLQRLDGSKVLRPQPRFFPFSPYVGKVQFFSKQLARHMARHTIVPLPDFSYPSMCIILSSWGYYCFSSR